MEDSTVGTVFVILLFVVWAILSTLGESAAAESERRKRISYNQRHRRND